MRNSLLSASTIKLRDYINIQNGQTPHCEHCQADAPFTTIGALQNIYRWSLPPYTPREIPSAHLRHLVSGLLQPTVVSAVTFALSRWVEFRREFDPNRRMSAAETHWCSSPSRRQNTPPNTMQRCPGTEQKKIHPPTNQLVGVWRKAKQLITQQFPRRIHHMNRLPSEGWLGWVDIEQVRVCVKSLLKGITQWLRPTRKWLYETKC